MSAAQVVAWAIRCDHTDGDRQCSSVLHVDGAADPERLAVFAAERSWSAGAAGDRCPKHTEVTS